MAIRGRRNTVATKSVEVMVTSVGLAILAVLSALGILGLGGAFSRTLDLLNHFTPLYLMASLGLGAAAWRVRSRFWGLPVLAIVGALSSGALVAPEWLAGLAEPKPTPNRPADLIVKVLTENIWEHNPNETMTVASILGVDADIVVLQEANGPSKEIVERLAQTYPYRADCVPLSEWCSMAILSKRPVLA